MPWFKRKKESYPIERASTTFVAVTAPIEANPDARRRLAFGPRAPSSQLQSTEHYARLYKDELPTQEYAILPVEQSLLHDFQNLGLNSAAPPQSHSNAVRTQPPPPYSPSVPRWMAHTSGQSSPERPPPIPPRPSSLPPPPQSSSSSTPASHTPARLTSSSHSQARREPLSPSTPTRHGSDRSRQSSLTGSPLPSSSDNRCCGITGAGKRCTRVVGTAASSPRTSPVKPKPESNMRILEQHLVHVPKFCHQHAKQSMKERGCFVRAPTGSQWVEFKDWIPDSLPEQTQVLLRLEMSQEPSVNDEPGYIYVHEFAPPEPSRSAQAPISTTTYVKLGRSVAPIHRLAQWRAQCPSHHRVIRGIFPRPTTTTASRQHHEAAIPRAPDGLSIAPRGLVNHKKWERLCLIELAGRSIEQSSSAAASSPRNNNNSKGKSKGKEGKDDGKCRDCGKRHLELFQVDKDAYDDWIVELVERWGRFVATCTVPATLSQAK